jgi:hypothetical protein
LTIRNAIRHVIHTGGATGLSPDDPKFEKFPAGIAQQLADINVAASREPHYGFNLSSDLCQLREASMKLTSSMVDVDKQGLSDPLLQQIVPDYSQLQWTILLPKTDSHLLQELSGYLCCLYRR